MTDSVDKPIRSEIVLNQTEDGKTRLEVRLENETVWLTQANMASLFQTTTQNITLHLRNIFQEGELDEASTCKDFLQVQEEGGRCESRAGVRRLEFDRRILRNLQTGGNGECLGRSPGAAWRRRR